MALNYRKRVKIFPGVHINFSKNGVSTSIGPKGAKFTIGKKGTYLNTSIPGTGLYSRKKISGNSDTSIAEEPSKHIKETHKEEKGFFAIGNNWGCCFRWLGLIAIIYLLFQFVCVLTGHFNHSQENDHALEGAGIIAVLFIIVYLKRIIHLFKRKHKNNKQIGSKSFFQ